MLVSVSFRAKNVCMCAGASSVKIELKASSIINVMAFRVASNVPLAPHGIPEYQCITHTRYDSGHVTNSVSVCHHEANSAQCRPCVNSCDMNPSFFSPSTPPTLQEEALEASRGGVRSRKVTPGRGGHAQDRTPSFLFMVVGTLVVCMRS